MARKLDHIGIVVNNVDEALSLYGRMLGLIPWSRGVQENPKTGMRMVILPVGDTFIELIQPPPSENRLARFLKERGEGVCFLAYLVENYDEELRALQAKGFPVEQDESWAFGKPFKRAWLPPESAHGVWIQLVDIAGLPDYLVTHNF